MASDDAGDSEDDGREFKMSLEKKGAAAIQVHTRHEYGCGISSTIHRILYA